jgi:diguanylate cyclase (GGDEF)-like protein/putative nucleotidyltransferase with HDIG domain
MMKYFQIKTHRFLNKYITLTQILFFLLTGILLFRVYNISFENIMFQKGHLLLFVFLFTLCPLLQKVNLKALNYPVIWDFLIMAVYIGVVVYFLILEQDPLFRIVLLMPVITMALKYGVLLAYFFAVVSSLPLFINSYANQFVTVDVDIVLTGVIFLLAWLLGNLAENEYASRKELERLATHDGLTDILNHRCFQSILKKEINKAREKQTFLTLIILDIDYFKQYNDAYGHQEGDKVLYDLAQMLQEIIGDRGFCARYGGEEFAVILPERDLAQGKAVGEELNQMIQNHDFHGAEILPEGRLTISIGVAVFPLHASNEKILIKKADEALYRAKFISRNRVESYYSDFDQITLFLKEEEKELFNSISAFTMIINAKDDYTYGHSLRVMELAKRLALRLELKGELIQQITSGALLHDIGKMEIPRDILNKQGRLTKKEWELFRQHPGWGADIISPLKSLSELSDIISCHHENFDGTGYPEGIRGEDIPLGARILRIVDSYDAMTTVRPYQSALSSEAALEDLAKYSGTHYDPWILKEFIQMMRESNQS